MIEKRKPGRPRGTLGGGPKLRGTAKRIDTTITLDPDLRILVQWHATARGNSVSESVNILLGEALRHHTVDTEAQEVH